MVQIVSPVLHMNIISASFHEYYFMQASFHFHHTFFVEGRKVPGKLHKFLMMSVDHVSIDNVGGDGIYARHMYVMIDWQVDN